jgi:hypothetical protein
MKIKSILFLLFLQCLSSAFGQTITNGVFVNLKPTAIPYQLFCGKHTEFPSKSSGDPLVVGKTYDVDKCAYDLLPTNDTALIQFSNDLKVKVGTNTTFGINIFSQEVLNDGLQPQRLHVGASSLAATITGEGVFFYQNKDTNSSCVISTPVIDIELHVGRFYINTTETKTIVAVLNGSITAHTTKKSKDITEGNALIAQPNEIGILEDTIQMSVEKFKADKIKGAEDSDGGKNIIFLRINGKTIGADIN